MAFLCVRLWNRRYERVNQKSADRNHQSKNNQIIQQISIIMGLLKEPLHVDFYIQSTPWTAEELADFRIVMQELKAKYKRKKEKKAVAVEPA